MGNLSDTLEKRLSKTEQEIKQKHNQEVHQFEIEKKILSFIIQDIENNFVFGCRANTFIHNTYEYRLDKMFEELGIEEGEYYSKSVIINTLEAISIPAEIGVDGIYWTLTLTLNLNKVIRQISQ